MEKKEVWPYVLTAILLLNGAIFGALLGRALAVTVNTKNTENFTDFETTLPTRLLDINGELITEFSSDEKRELVSLNDLPQHMIDALVTREDRIFYQHKGFSAKALTRAVIGQILNISVGGGSTLTQQIAGTLYCDRSEMSLMRKLKELWWAFQMERRYSKDEILELYLNKIYFGGGTYGVTAASKYYFGHSSHDITPAEAAILVVQLSNPAFYNPFEHPNRAMDRQRYVLTSMVEAGYLTPQESEESFSDYWANFDYTRTNSSAYDMRTDEAPWFSEYVRRELSSTLYGTEDIYTSGFTVNTSINLSHQRAADEILKKYIAYANATYQKQLLQRQQEAFKEYIPLTELFSVVFGLPKLKVSEERAEALSLKEYRENINPVLDLVSLIGGMDTFKTSVVNRGNTLIKKNAEKTTIEGTMISLENSTGRIDALVGGSNYGSDNQFIRAVQALLQPGSTFKPLYYSAAIDSREYQWSTVISDTPVVFYNRDGTLYIPQDFKGVYEGDVQLWYALAHSMNIPSIKILDSIGFDAAISRAMSLLGISSDQQATRGFEPVYPIGLGVCSVRPIELAKAYATFANQGREVTPISILNVQDRNGNIILNPEKELRDKQKAQGERLQVVSKQNAFVMTELLKNTVQTGTLAYGSDYNSTRWTIGERNGWGSKFVYTGADGKEFEMPAAGKTGTTQNWADAWTAGFTPYYTSVFWFGFDMRGQSLGLQITGSTLAGVAWGDYMHVANEGKPYRDFFADVPDGVVKVDICTVSGGIAVAECGSRKMSAYFLEGTEPKEPCKRHTDKTSDNLFIGRLEKQMLMSGVSFDNIISSSGLVARQDVLNGTITDFDAAMSGGVSSSMGQSSYLNNTVQNTMGNWLFE